MTFLVFKNEKRQENKVPRKEKICLTSPEDLKDKGKIIMFLEVNCVYNFRETLWNHLIFKAIKWHLINSRAYI